MKRWMLYSTAAILAACSKGGGNGVGVNQAVGGSSCEAASQNTLVEQTPQNPFEVYGKVLVTGDNDVSAKNYQQISPADMTLFSDPAHAPFILAQKNGGVRIKAGTELTVVLREECSRGGELTRSILDSNGADEGVTPSGVRAYTWHVPVDTDSSRLEEIAESDSCIEGIADSQKSFATEISAEESPTDLPTALPTDPRAGEQGHLKYLEAGEAYPVLLPRGVPGKPIVIAVADTGIDTTHDEFRDMLWVNEDEIAGNGIDDDKNGYVDDVNGYNFASKKASPHFQGSWSGYHHGTHVSGLAAAAANNGKGGAGVMGAGVKIMHLNVFGTSSGAYSSNIANAIRYAADNGADVINLSVGGSGRNAAYEAALTYAVQKGVTVFAAAGNERSELGPSYFMSPGGYGQQIPGMVTVGSVDSSDSKFSTFSNYSPVFVEIGAPGSEESSGRTGLLSTMPNNKYLRIQGTSMSSPVAAGAGALAIAALRERGYRATPAMVEDIMSNSGRVFANLQSKIRGGRVLNLKSMADYINQKFPPGGSAEAGGPGGPVNSELQNCSTGANL